MISGPHDLGVVLVHLALGAVALLLVVIDVREHRLPNRIVLPTLAALVLLVGVEWGATGEAARAIRALLGMVLLCAFYLAMRAASRNGVGGGDVKLSAVLGLVLGWHGWGAFAIGAASAFLLGAVHALVLMAAKRADRTTRIAFGPWMIAGAALGIAVG